MAIDGGKRRKISTGGTKSSECSFKVGNYNKGEGGSEDLPNGWKLSVWYT